MEKILPAWFTNFKTGDLHITQAAGAIYKKAPPIPDVTTDYDGQPRNKSGPRDIGADEFGTVKEPASAPATKPAK